VLGILGFFCISPVLAIIFGIIAIRQIANSQGRQRGRGLAIAGLVLGIVWVLFLLAMLVSGAIASVLDESAEPTRSEFVARFSDAFEDDPEFDLESFPEDQIPEVKLAISDFASCGYDVLQDEPEYLEAVYEDPTADGYTLYGLSQSRIDELDEQFERVCAERFTADIEEIAGG
jgi:hypothetical protein